MRTAGFVVALVVLSYSHARAQEAVSTAPTVKLAPTPEEIARQVDQIRKVVRATDFYLKADFQKNISGASSLMTLDGVTTTAAAVSNSSKKEIVGQWAQSTASLMTGLSTAGAVAQVANVTLIYKPEDAGQFASLLDIVGKAGAVAGLVMAASDGEKKDGFYLSAGSLGVTQAIDAVRKYAKRKDGPLRVFVERASMHKEFSADIVALRNSLAALQPISDSLYNIANRLRIDGTADGGATYANFQVTSDVVGKYRLAVDSYSNLTALLASANSKAKALKSEDWTADIRQNLTDIEAQTGNALEKWRQEIIVSHVLADAMQELIGK